MKRRNTVSVTPAMGASTVAGEIATPAICKLGGKTSGGRTLLSADRSVVRVGGAAMFIPAGFSQNLRTYLFYVLSNVTRTV